MSRKRLSLGLAAYAMDKVVVAVIQLFTIPVLVNTWGLELFGIWTVLMTMPSFLVLSDFGIVNSAWARMVAFVSREEWDRAKATLDTAWSVTNLIVLATFLIAGAVIMTLPGNAFPSSASFPENSSRLTIIFLLAYGLLSIVFRLNTAAFRAALRYSFASLAATSLFAIENVAVLIVALVGYGPVVAAAALLALRCLGILILTGFSIVQLPKLRPGFARAANIEWREMWRPALAASALGFGLAGYLQGSVVLLGAIGGAITVPAFVAVRTLSRLGVQFSTLISMPVSQEFGHAMGQGQSFRAGRLFGVVLGIAVATSVLAGASLVLIGKPFIDLWTNGAIHAEPNLLIFMAISSVAAMLWNPLANFILAVNRQSSYSYINLAISAVGLLFIYLTADRLGAASAGLSFALVDVVTLAAIIIFIRRNWSGVDEFKRGALSSLGELCRPIAMLKSLRSARGGANQPRGSHEH